FTASAPTAIYTLSLHDALPILNEPLTSFEDITNYNNFYEFDTEKRGVASAARGFVTQPWKVEVGGLVNQPKIFDLDDLLKIAPRSEEHTSELQSRGHLVCRLLL